MVYDDGEVDDAICAACVRPYVPYQVGEETDWTDRESDFVAAKITAVNGEDSYEVELEDGRKLSNVSASNLRRTLGKNPGVGQKEVGSRVLTYFPGAGKSVFHGTVVAINGDYYSVQYDDGDFSDQISKGMIVG